MMVEERQVAGRVGVNVVLLPPPLIISLSLLNELRILLGTETGVWANYHTRSAQF